MFNWELFTEETNVKLQGLLDKYDIEYYVDHTTESKYYYKEIATYQSEFGGEPFLRVKWGQDRHSTIDILDRSEGTVTESLVFGEPDSKLEDFEVFSGIDNVEDFVPDTEDFSSVYHLKNGDFDDPVKRNDMFPDSEVEAYRTKFFENQIDAVTDLLIEIKEEYEEM